MKSSTATATTATADGGRPRTLPYVGRFAPSPTGDLHLGSLYTAAGAYLESRSHRGRFLVRIEDLDRPREVPGAAGRILATLETFGFEWDGAVMRQSARSDQYAAALQSLTERDLLFACTCSRSQLPGSAPYPGTCRTLRLPSGPGAALRIRVEPDEIVFTDRVQGEFRQDLAATGGDFIVRRRDGPAAYALAVVVDDAAQGVSDVVRGADLLPSTPQQIHLQRALALPTPAYAHLPLLTEPDGAKLAKSRHSRRLDVADAGAQLLRVFAWLGLDPPRSLAGAPVAELWPWALDRWSLRRVPRCPSLALPPDPVTGS